MGHNIVKQNCLLLERIKLQTESYECSHIKEIVVNLGIVLYPSHTVSSIENRNISPKEIKNVAIPNPSKYKR